MLRNFSSGHQVSAGARRSLSRRKELPVVILGLCLLLFAPNPSAQAVDLLSKGGHVIDPRNGIDAVLDVAIVEGKIAKVAANISPAGAKQVLDAKGLLVTPGLVDIHAHVFYGMEGGSSYSGGYNAVPPDPFTFRSGVTTIVDAGGSGWRDFARFKVQVIDRAETRVLAFLNIVGAGMKGGAAEQNLADMDPERTAARVRQFPEIIVGVKAAPLARLFVLS